MSNTNYERSANSQEWYTPKCIIDKLGEFDLDPCSPIEPLHKIARNTFNVITDGLSQNWGGYEDVYLNPPYKHPLIDQFVDKMVEHNNGIALLFSRTDTKMWQDKILPRASGLLFIKGRVAFLMPNGEPNKAATCSNVLVSFGDACSERLKNCGIRGFYVDLRK